MTGSTSLDLGASGSSGTSAGCPRCMRTVRRPFLVSSVMRSACAVQHVDGERMIGGGVDDHLVVEERVRGERAGVVDEVERRVAAAADGAAGPRAHGDLDDVAGLELGPADRRPRPPSVLLFGERDAARCAVHARAEDLGVVALGGDRLVELVLRCAAR